MGLRELLHGLEGEIADLFIAVDLEMGKEQEYGRIAAERSEEFNEPKLRDVAASFVNSGFVE
jgi:hypothetical protein